MDGATAVSTSVGNDDVKSAKHISSLLNGLAESLRVDLQDEWAVKQPSASIFDSTIAFLTHDIELVGLGLDVILLAQLFGLLVTGAAAVCL